MGLVVTLTYQLSSRCSTWHWRPCNASTPPKQLQLFLSICFVGRYTTWMLALTIVLGPATLPPTRLTICWVQVRSPSPRKTSSTEAEVCKVRETLKWILGGAGELQFAFQAACDGAVVRLTRCFECFHSLAVDVPCPRHTLYVCKSLGGALCQSLTAMQLIRQQYYAFKGPNWGSAAEAL